MKKPKKPSIDGSEMSSGIVRARIMTNGGRSVTPTIGITIPKYAAKAAGIKEGDMVMVTGEEKGILSVVSTGERRKSRKPRKTTKKA